MSLGKLVPLALAVGLISATGATAQVLNPDFKLSKPVVAFQDSPTSAGGGYTKRSTGGGQAKKWLEVEVAFDWQPRLKDPKYLNDLTFTYYILLDNAEATLDHKQTMLVGSVTHTNVAQERDLHSVIYASPRSMERLFNGSLKPTAAGAVFDIGVTISQQGQVVAETSLKGHGEWWTQYKQTTGLLLNKSETPFSALAWDYYEEIKPKTSAQ